MNETLKSDLLDTLHEKGLPPGLSKVYEIIDWLELEHNLFLQFNYGVKNFEPVCWVYILELVSTDNEDIEYITRQIWDRIPIKERYESGITGAFSLIK